MTLQTGIEDIVDIASPTTTANEDQYFITLSSKGHLKVFNYTVIESQQAYMRYIKDHFGI